MPVCGFAGEIKVAIAPAAFSFYPLLPVPIRDRMPGLAKTLAAVIYKALVRNPKDRFPDAAGILNSLKYLNANTELPCRT